MTISGSNIPPNSTVAALMPPSFGNYGNTGSNGPYQIILNQNTTAVRARWSARSRSATRTARSISPAPTPATTPSPPRSQTLRPACFRSRKTAAGQVGAQRQ